MFRNKEIRQIAIWILQNMKLFSWDRRWSLLWSMNVDFDGLGGTSKSGMTFWADTPTQTMAQIQSEITDSGITCYLRIWRYDFTDCGCKCIQYHFNEYPDQAAGTCHAALNRDVGTWFQPDDEF